jgi:hypothetical protein
MAVGWHSTSAINYCCFSENLILIKPTINIYCQPLKTAQNVATHFNEPKKWVKLCVCKVKLFRCGKLFDLIIEKESLSRKLKEYENKCRYNAFDHEVYQVHDEDLIITLQHVSALQCCVGDASSQRKRTTFKGQPAENSWTDRNQIRHKWWPF